MLSSSTSRRLRSLAKLLLGLAIVAYLLYQASSGENFDHILHEPKQWPMLVAALLCVTVAVGMGFVRWYLLVKAVELPFTLADAMRLGSLGFALNFVGPGGVGGDLFKGVVLAREHAKRKTEAVATVIADRVLGLTGLLAVTAAATLFTGVLWNTEAPTVMRTVGGFAVAAFASLVVVGSLLMVHGPIGKTTARLLGKLPLVGGVVGSLFVSCQVISRRPIYLVPAFLLSIALHLLLVLAFHCVALGLPLEHPSLATHMCIVPLAESTSVLPIPGGLGTTEAALNALYYGLGLDGDAGTLVAFGQRLAMFTVGIFAIGYYLTQRKEVATALHEAEDQLDHAEEPLAQGADIG
ncbi:lysylphosphatidylglycerol synthase transmembrane domain-containing protein [Aeoliella mucimassa]|uniref:Uncharacterized protein n=1 Tax=Aeoliella mucimassa TaxID=2527972 RepID=A0A518AJH5_9BACT|nr:lysylphosphatidylglycerol synthase transmembrane domain-containing protein [Aeoliella mucimassa]QDU54889.1 hypothetical protein Pan181_10730 [Aeoliella mucimassa]